MPFNESYCHLSFNNDMSRLVRGVAVLLMVCNHSLPGKLIPFAVPLFSFLVGYGYNFARQRSLKHSAKRIWHLLSHFWFILFAICLPCALFVWKGEVKIEEVALSLFGLCARFNFFCWYIYFYIAAMFLLPVLSRIIDRHGLKAVILQSLFFGGAACAVYLWANSYLTTGKTNLISALYRICRYMPIVITGYWLARNDVFSKIVLKIHWTRTLAAVLLLTGLYFLRGVPFAMFLDLVWAPLGTILIAALFNTGKFKWLRKPLNSLGIHSMGIWFLHALFFTHSTKDVFFPLIKWIPADNWGLDWPGLVKGGLRVPLIILLSYLMAVAVDFALGHSRNVFNHILTYSRNILKKPYISLAKVIPVFIPVLLFSGCAVEKKSADFGKETFHPEYAKSFAIRETDSLKSIAIDVYNPWQGADGVCQSIFVIRGSENVPDSWIGQTVHEAPKSIVVTSSTHVALLDALGEADRIVGVSGKQYISNPLIRAKGDSVADIGYDSGVDYETLVSLKPDLVLLYGVASQSPLQNRLEQVGIPYMYVGEYTEEHPLGKAEWIVPVGEVLGKGELARNTFRNIADRYCALSDKVDSITAKPKVILSLPEGDSWLMPSAASYVATLMKDAGAEYVYKRNTGNASRPLDIEKAYELALQADYWMDVQLISSLDALRRAAPKFSEVPPVIAGMVYNNNLRETPGGGNDYYESGVVNPDLILMDLISIFHPALLPGHQLHYYRKLK